MTITNLFLSAAEYGAAAVVFAVGCYAVYRFVLRRDRKIMRRQRQRIEALKEDKARLKERLTKCRKEKHSQEIQDMQRRIDKLRAMNSNDTS